MAGFLGPLVLVRLLGNTFRLPSEYVDLICMLRVFCFWASTSWTCSSSSSSSSSSSCLDRRLRLLWFRSARSRSLYGLVLGLALFLIYDDNRMGVFVFFFRLGIIYIMFLLHESCSTVTAILFILVFHTILSILFVHVCPRRSRRPAPCAVDLCLWAQITWRFRSSCVGCFPWVGM